MQGETELPIKGTAGSLGFKEGTKLHVCLKLDIVKCLSAPKMQVFVNFLTGKRLTIWIYSDSTVLELKAEIYDAEGDTIHILAWASI